MGPSAGEHRLYQSYLLRLWRNAGDDRWRLSVRCVQSAREWHFACPEAFVSFLLRQLDG